MQKKIYIPIIAVLSCLLVGAVAFIIFNKTEDKPPALPTDDSAVDWTGDKPTNKLKSGQAGIAIPGFESLVFTANQTNQQVNFYNPESNNCLFLMSLYADDTLIWQSGYVAPGKGFYDIELTTLLKAGDYSGNLKVQCFRSDGTALNSANVKFDLKVQEEQNQ